MNNKDSNPKESKMASTAAESLKERTGSIEWQIEQLQTRLQAHNKQAAQHPKNWGYVGNLDHVEAQLQELVDFLRAYANE